MLPKVVEEGEKEGVGEGENEGVAEGVEEGVVEGVAYWKEEKTRVLWKG